MLHVQTCSGTNHIIPLMRQSNTDSAPNMPIMLPRNQVLIRWVPSTLSRYIVTVHGKVTLCTQLNGDCAWWSTWFSNCAVNRRLVVWYHSSSHKQKKGFKQRKRKSDKKIQNGEKKSDVCVEILDSKILQSKRCGKAEPKLLMCLNTEQIKNKAISKPWKKWRWWVGAQVVLTTDNWQSSSEQSSSHD
jgi:hypothetical protein